MAAKQDGAAEELASLLHAKKELEDKLALLPVARPKDVVEPLLLSVQRDRRFQLAAQCETGVLHTSLKEFCDGFYRLRAEIAIAAERDALDQKLAGLSARLADMKRSREGAGDVQSSQIAVLLGLEPSVVRRVLGLGFALVVEIGSGLGLYLVMGLKAGQKPNPNDRRSWRRRVQRIGERYTWLRRLGILPYVVPPPKRRARRPRRRSAGAEREPIRTEANKDVPLATTPKKRRRREGGDGGPAARQD
jgi:hypothetical protein